MSRCPERPRRRLHGGATRRVMLESLVSGCSLDTVVRAALDILERDPLTAAACFPGDLLRGLMEVPRSFWGPNPGLYERYLTVVRAGAAARRRLPLEQRMTFWGPLDLETVRRSTHVRPDDLVRADSETMRG
jgi:hypothetical protein